MRSRGPPHCSGHARPAARPSWDARWAASIISGPATTRATTTPAAAAGASPFPARRSPRDAESERDNSAQRNCIPHDENAHLTRARSRSTVIGAVRTATHGEVSIHWHGHSRSARPNCCTGTARKRQQPGCESRVWARTDSFQPSSSFPRPSPTSRFPNRTYGISPYLGSLRRSSEGTSASLFRRSLPQPHSGKHLQDPFHQGQVSSFGCATSYLLP